MTIKLTSIYVDNLDNALRFYTDDVKGDYERIDARGGAFIMPPTKVPGSTIAKLNDTCGNLIQITQLARW